MGGHADEGTVVVSPAGDETDATHGHDGAHGEQAGEQEDDLIRHPPTSYNALSNNLTTALSTLTSLLTNPSFAPIEEVHTREDEIQRLRDGWEKMERRWREGYHYDEGVEEQDDQGGDGGWG